MIKTADYPDHPDSIVIHKNELLEAGPEIKEIDVYNYYSGVSNKMLPELKNKNLFIAIKPEGTLKPGQKPIYIRHPYDKKTDYIHINNKEEFEIYHSGRTVEFHTTMPAECFYYIIDFDAVEDWNTTKKITAEIADKLEKLPEVEKIEIRYSGKRGFHILGKLKKSKPIDKAREDLKAWLTKTFGNRKDLVIGESPEGSKGALGVSPMKLNGGQVALWSLRITGLCCVPVLRTQLMSFKRENASLANTYKKVTGKKFVFSDIKKMASRVVYAFLQIQAGYDREKLQSGYKGKFVIHFHSAEKAGKHWDLRLEYPVTSVSKALGTYGSKRDPSSREPQEDYEDKPGTVYRSFVTKKREIPTKDTKIYLIETENHPIEYGKFHGKIEEGYGKGSVEIWDDGSYELLSVEGDHKCVIDFHGKKLKGIFAFIKYKQGFLWIKVMDKKLATNAVINKFRLAEQEPIVVKKIDAKKIKQTMLLDAAQRVIEFYNGSETV